MNRRASAALFALAATLLSAPASATDFHVWELDAGYELHRTGGGHGTYGVGWTWDTFVTAPTLRGVELGTRLDVLHCPSCDHKFDGGQIALSTLFTFWKDDLSTVTFYFGPAFGGGYSRATEVPFALVELQAALQVRSIYDGIWFRPVLFAGAGGAYDGYTSLGLRVAFGYAFNHGEQIVETPPPPPPPGSCNPPVDADLPSSESAWVVPHCFRRNASARVDGHDVTIADRGGDLEIKVGPSTPGTTQQVEIFVAGGVFTAQLRRR